MNELENKCTSPEEEQHIIWRQKIFRIPEIEPSHKPSMWQCGGITYHTKTSKPLPHGTEQALRIPELPTSQFRMTPILRVNFLQILRLQKPAIAPSPWGLPIPFSPTVLPRRSSGILLPCSPSEPVQGHPGWFSKSLVSTQPFRAYSSVPTSPAQCFRASSVAIPRGQGEEGEAPGPHPPAEAQGLPRTLSTSE